MTTAYRLADVRPGCIVTFSNGTQTIIGTVLEARRNLPADLATWSIMFETPAGELQIWDQRTNPAELISVSAPF